MVGACRRTELAKSAARKGFTFSFLSICITIPVLERGCRTHFALLEAKSRRRKLMESWTPLVLFAEIAPITLRNQQYHAWPSRHWK